VDILFPGKACQGLCVEAQHAYYVTHYKHVKNYLSFVGNVIVTNDDTTIDGTSNNNFIVTIDGKRIMFDYSDFDYNTVELEKLDADIKYFKIHTTEKSHSRCLPFPPMSFIDWDIYDRLENVVTYNPTGSIFYKCKAYGAATERREMVLSMLESYHGVPVDFTYTKQLQYFESLKNCRINVVVPGARIDILDRTHLQSFAFGIPVITSKISTLLPFGEKFEAGIDYIECLPDFSNVIDLIETYKNDIEYLNFISNNCRTKFLATCSTLSVAKWLLTT
jgi:hypothetical protein